MAKSALIELIFPQITNTNPGKKDKKKPQLPAGNSDRKPALFLS